MRPIISLEIVVSRKTFARISLFYREVAVARTTDE